MTDGSLVPLVRAQAGTQGPLDVWLWMPVFAGMSGVWGELRGNRSSPTALEQ